MVRDLDPAVERVILRCLEHDPTLRPGIGACLSPQRCPAEIRSPRRWRPAKRRRRKWWRRPANTSAFSLRIGLSTARRIIVGLLTVAALSDRVLLIARIPLDKSADALEDRARETSDAKLGLHRAAGRHGARIPPSCRTTSSTCCEPITSPTRWNATLERHFPVASLLVSHEPARARYAVRSNWRPEFGDPPMTIIRHDLARAGHHKATSRSSPWCRRRSTMRRAAPGMDWSPLFDAAGLDAVTFNETPSQWVPKRYADQRKAWVGPMPGKPDIKLRVEAGAYRGRPSFFQVVGPWTRRPRMADPQQSQTGASIIRFGLFLIVLSCSVEDSRWLATTSGAAVATARERRAFRLFVLCTMIGVMDHRGTTLARPAHRAWPLLRKPCRGPADARRDCSG